MAEPRPETPALLVVACFSRHPAALDWGRQRLEEAHGPVALVSPDLDFNQTDYYQPSMGPGLRKRFLAFAELVAPDTLPALKHFTNRLERELAGSGQFPEPRPLNLDPGHLVLGKFLLATVKDHAHRVYLRDGIFAEVTLHYTHRAWQPWPWTFADYRRAEVLEFLTRAREYYASRLQRRTRGETRD